jgi:4a-hydroxytetrahydrobiopterin dehydratase
MADPTQKLSPSEIAQEGLADWRRMLTGIGARFNTGDFATGLALVQRIGEAAEDANHHPDITLTYPQVKVMLSSHDVGGITSRDIELARRITLFAAEAGIAADPLQQTEVELCLDTESEEKLSPFYAALLGDQPAPMWFQEPDGEGTALPQAVPPQRWHLDVWVPVDEAEERVRRVLEAGGHLVSDAEAPSYWVLEDADGNRSCICSAAAR